MAHIGIRRAHLSRGVSALGIAAALLIASPAAAQTAGAIRGENGTPGATVTATDTVTGRSVTSTVGADGTFIIVGLRPSSYRVEAGGETQELTLPVGLTVTVDLSPEIAPDPGSDEAIVVTGRRNRAEVRTATVGTSISPEQLRNLPQNDRNFLNFAALAPGVTISPDPNNRQIQAGGVSSNNVNVFIDGTSQKNQVGFGGVAGQNFSAGNPFPQSAVQEFRVETQNFKAEYEQAGSAIITAITRTGGQDFSGGAFADYVPKSFFGRPFFDRPGEANNPGRPCADNASETCFLPKPDFKRWQFGADLGGPIIPGTLHFFGAYEGTRQTNPSANVVFPTDSMVPIEVQNRFTGSFPAEFKQNLYFGKLTLFAGDHTINASYFRREEQDFRDFGGNRAFESSADLNTSTENYQLEWNWRGENWLNEMIVGRLQSFTGTPRITQSPSYILTTNTDGGGDLLIFGGAFFEQANEQDAWTVRNNFTYTGIDGHVIKAGARVSITTLGRLESAFGLGQYRYVAAGFTDVDTTIPYQASVSLLPPGTLEAENTQVGLFVQDDWELNDNLTLNIGLRWDYESNPFNNKFVTPTRIADALRAYQPWQAAGIDADDYISTGNNRDPFLGAFQPRIGLSYDVFGDRDLVFFIGAGRYYDRNIFLNAALETLFNTVRSDLTVRFCGQAGTPACPAGTPAAPGSPTSIAGTFRWSEAFRDPDVVRQAVAGAGLAGDVWVLNNDTPTPFTDQYNIGVRKQAGPVLLSAVIAHNRSFNGFMFVRGNRQADGNYTDGGDAWIRDPGAMTPEMFLPGYTGRLNFGSSIGQTRFTALYLTAEKPYNEADGWALTASLTLSDAKSNQGRFFDSSEMFNAGRQDAFGWQKTGGLQPWTFVASGLVDLPWGLQLGAIGTFSSGPRFGTVRFDLRPPNCPGCLLFNEGGVFSPSELPDGGIGYANVDLRLAKTFEIFGTELTVDGEVFNVFDSVNRNYSTWGAGSGPDAPMNENSTTGRARSFQVGASVRF